MRSLQVNSIYTTLQLCKMEKSVYCCTFYMVVNTDEELERTISGKLPCPNQNRFPYSNLNGKNDYHLHLVKYST